MSKDRRKLLVRLESIIGNECYNGSIQNYGPGGVREGDGRAFRYPLTVRTDRNEETKIRDVSIPPSVPSEALLSGYYSFGANQLDIMTALNKIIDHLERQYGLIVSKTSDM